MARMRLGAVLAPALEPRWTALEPPRCDIVAVITVTM
jgi:hypothetical protein